MDEIAKRYIRIKNWMMNYGKFVINERESENNFHFSFWIWGNKKGKIVFPLLVGYLRQQIKRKECLIIWFKIVFDTKPDVVSDAVIKNPTKRMLFVAKLKKIIESKEYRLMFFPVKKT